MGQYSIAVCLDKQEYVDPHDYDEGRKLMEHSFVGCDYVSAVEKLLSAGGTWNGCHIVWAGDYLDDEKYLPENVKNSSIGKKKPTLYEYAYKHFKKLHPEPKENCGNGYLVNLDTKEYVKIDGCPEYDGYKVHPLPLLTYPSNKMGGGDYYDESGAEEVGSWAGNRLMIVAVKPETGEEIKPNFIDK